MATASEIRACLQNHRERLKAIDYRISQYQNKLNAPHIRVENLAAAAGRVEDARRILNEVERNFHDLELESTDEYLNQQIDAAVDEKTECREMIGKLKADLELAEQREAAHTDDGKPVMTQLNRAMAELRKLPQEQVQEILNSILLSKKEGDDGTQTTTTTNGNAGLGASDGADQGISERST